MSLNILSDATVINITLPITLSFALGYENFDRTNTNLSAEVNVVAFIPNVTFCSHGLFLLRKALSGR